MRGRAVQRTPLRTSPWQRRLLSFGAQSLYRWNISEVIPLAQRQSATIDPVTEYHLGELEIALDPSRPEHILPDVQTARVGIVDVGCGMGQLFVAKASEIPVGVGRYGFDIDKASIAYAIEHWPEKARFAVAPAEKLPLPDASVDLYVSRVTLPYTDIPAALAEAARVLAPGGRLWITLHPLSMTWHELAQAARGARLKEVVRRMVVLWNGLAFHLFGTSQSVFGIRDAWQSSSRMTRALTQHFTDIRVGRGRHFLIEATRRSP
jgi:ubiquinone/menaquinone biosynthesis C-methylase UbiE